LCEYWPVIRLAREGQHSGVVVIALVKFTPFPTNRLKTVGIVAGVRLRSGASSIWITTRFGRPAFFAFPSAIEGARTSRQASAAAPSATTRLSRTTALPITRLSG
jgi:hypothetical protein